MVLTVSQLQQKTQEIKPLSLNNSKQPFYLIVPLEEDYFQTISYRTIRSLFQTSKFVCQIDFSMRLKLRDKVLRIRATKTYSVPHPDVGL